MHYDERGDVIVERDKLRERAMAGDPEAVDSYASWLRFDNAPGALEEMEALAEATHLPSVIQLLAIMLFEGSDVDGLRRWSAESAEARDFIPLALANIERQKEVAVRSATGDRKAGWELAVRFYISRDRNSLENLVDDGNPVAAALLSDILFMEDDIEGLKALADTGVAACVHNYAVLADDDEVERLAAAGNLIAFQHRCQDFIQAGDSTGLQAFLDALPATIELT